MKYSYFVLFSDNLQYPVYVAFEGIMSLTTMRNCVAAWSVIYHVTCIPQKDYFIEECSYNDFFNALIKIDFTEK